jgi:hypothetical protein
LIPLFQRAALRAAALALALSLLPASTVQAAQDISPRFASYYTQHQGLRLLGNPVSGLAFAYGYPVQYFEKARIEDHRGESGNPEWAFAYGRLTAEMMASGSASLIAVSQTNLKYSDLRTAAEPSLRRPAPPGFTGGTAPIGRTTATFVPFDAALGVAPGYAVPEFFWTYINRKDLFPGGWLHDIGLPMTEALPATVVKNGETRQITLQAFERTVLSYDPANPPTFQVERANIGWDALAGQAEIGVDTVGQVQIPQAGARVTLPLHILARVHDRYNEVEARLQWQDGTVLTDTLPVLWEGDSGLIIGSIDWLTEGAPPQPTTKVAALTIHPKGSEVVLAKRDGLTVLPLDDPDTQQIQVFWTDEDHVEAVTQVIPRTEGVGRAAIEELLWGPGPRVSAFPNFGTALPLPEEVSSWPGRQPHWGPRVTLRGLSIKDGVATVDFSGEMLTFGGGSMRTGLMNSQITQTLKQFPTVKQVQIAIEGKLLPDGLFQP